MLAEIREGRPVTHMDFRFRWKQWKGVVVGMLRAGAMALSPDSIKRAAETQGLLAAFDPAIREAALAACDEGLLTHLPSECELQWTHGEECDPEEERLTEARSDDRDCGLALYEEDASTLRGCGLWRVSFPQNKKRGSGLKKKPVKPASPRRAGLTAPGPASSGSSSSSTDSSSTVSSSGSSSSTKSAPKKKKQRVAEVVRSRPERRMDPALAAWIGKRWPEEAARIVKAIEELEFFTPASKCGAEAATR